MKSMMSTGIRLSLKCNLWSTFYAQKRRPKIRCQYILFFNIFLKSITYFRHFSVSLTIRLHTKLTLLQGSGRSGWEGSRQGLASSVKQHVYTGLNLAITSASSVQAICFSGVKSAAFFCRAGHCELSLLLQYGFYWSLLFLFIPSHLYKASSALQVCVRQN